MKEFPLIFPIRAGGTYFARFSDRLAPDTAVLAGAMNFQVHWRNGESEARKS
ncbi:hypothetical protein [Lignipirellula cremea]|uniref:hypothetical protein n=1 Tax=Lignipirellula cremea TaxID=2528010 RepID=UPI0018D2282A|nr:hypothetical protein [Lignipirellula cremea]